VRGLLHSMHSNFGFDPGNVLMVNVDLNMAGYSGDKVAAMQNRMIESMRELHGWQSLGMTNQPPMRDCCDVSTVFNDNGSELVPSNAAAEVVQYRVSPEYFQAAGTALLSGR